MNVCTCISAPRQLGCTGSVFLLTTGSEFSLGITESRCKAVEAAGPGGFWIDSHDLVKEVKGIYQTVEGEFIAFHQSIDQRELGPIDLSLSSFPGSRAVVAIVAVDGCYFDVYSKDSEATSKLLEKFPGATVENPELYF